MTEKYFYLGESTNKHELITFQNAIGHLKAVSHLQDFKLSIPSIVGTSYYNIVPCSGCRTLYQYAHTCEIYTEAYTYTKDCILSFYQRFRDGGHFFAMMIIHSYIIKNVVPKQRE